MRATKVDVKTAMARNSRMRLLDAFDRLSCQRSARQEATEIRKRTLSMPLGSSEPEQTRLGGMLSSVSSRPVGTDKSSSVAVPTT